jgi:glycosyltransferase involved in cell wall biosynthesis
MPQVEAGACGKPVIGIKAMAMLETLVHGETAFLAGVAQEILIRETVLDEDAGYEKGHRFVFETPRTADYRASVHEIAEFLLELMTSPELRERMGDAARKRVVERYDYRVVAKRFVEIVSRRLDIV